MKVLCVYRAHSLCSHNAVFLCAHYCKDLIFQIMNYGTITTLMILGVKCSCHSAVFLSPAYQKLLIIVSLERE